MSAIAVPYAGEGIRSSWGGQVANALNKSVVAGGYQPFAYPLGCNYSTPSAYDFDLQATDGAKNGEALLVPFMLTGPMLFQGITLRGLRHATLTQTGEYRLYRDDGTSSLKMVPGTSGLTSLASGTAVVVDYTSNASWPGALVEPGLVYLIIRNSSSTSFLYLRHSADGVSNMAYSSNAISVPALADTFNSALLTNAWRNGFTIRLNGRVFGGTGAF